MISRDDVPDTPEWTLPPREITAVLTIPENITLGSE